jgi:murein DD-endopeptidase MepM/ murein hydrolase activator NlpD
VKSKNFTLMIVPDGPQARVRRVQVPLRRLFLIGIAVIALVGSLGSLLVHYAYVVGQVFEARTLRTENVRLQDRIAVLQAKVDDVDERLVLLKQFDEKLRAMTDLRDDARGLAMGPLKSNPQGGADVTFDIDPFAVPVEGDDPAVQQLREALLDSRMIGLAHEANRELRSLAELSEYFSVREAMLKSTPSIAPARGLLTSGFGSREDPFTSDHTMHAGLDIATREGVEVVAPASGTVIFAGEKAAYGNCVVIDHGRDLTTLYGHLQRFIVKPGDKVERGQHIGNVGNTGRSTGPHLHYEVRINGVPINPRRYVVH